MEEEQAKRKFEELQKYIPFLDKVIERLRDNVREQPDNPRTAQLVKMEMLHDLLTNRGNKLKLDSLLKCESVIIKLHTKIEKDGFNYSGVFNEMEHDKSTSENNYDYPCTSRDNQPNRMNDTDELLFKRRMEPEPSHGPEEHMHFSHFERRDKQDHFGHQKRHESRDGFSSHDRRVEYRPRHDFRDKHESSHRHGNSRERRDRHEDRNKGEPREKYDHRDKRDHHSGSHTQSHFDKLKNNSRSETACSSRNEMKVTISDKKNQDHVSKSVFDRLGNKISDGRSDGDTIKSEKKISSPLLHRAHSSNSSSRNGTKPDFTKTHDSPPVNKHVNVSIRDVLKNSPLTDNDITDLINENLTDEGSTDNLGLNSTAYGVGYRRSTSSWNMKKVPKRAESFQPSSRPQFDDLHSEKNPFSHSASHPSKQSHCPVRDTNAVVGNIETPQELSSLDIVRRKFALLAKGAISVPAENKSKESVASPNSSLSSGSNNVSIADHLTQCIKSPTNVVQETRCENMIIKDPRMQKRNQEQLAQRQPPHISLPTTTTSGSHIKSPPCNVDPRIERMTNTQLLNKNSSNPEMSNAFGSSVFLTHNNITSPYNADTVILSGNQFPHNNGLGIGYNNNFEGNNNMQVPPSHNFPVSNRANFQNIPNAFTADTSERFNSNTAINNSTFSNQSANRFYPEGIWDLKGKHFTPNQRDSNNRMSNNITITQNSTSKHTFSRYSPEENWDDIYSTGQSNNEWNSKKDNSTTNSNLSLSQKPWPVSNFSKRESIHSGVFQNRDYGKSDSKNVSENSSYEQSQPKLSKFNALLNDKSERIKYLESKKHKSEVPRTYAEHKLAKARESAQIKPIETNIKKEVSTINNKSKEIIKSEAPHTKQIEEKKKKTTDPNEKEHTQSKKTERTSQGVTDSLEIISLDDSNSKVSEKKLKCKERDVKEKKDGKHLREISKDEKSVRGKSKDDKNLRGTSKVAENLRGTSKDVENLRGTSKDVENLRGTSKDVENLRGTSKDVENLRGSSKDVENRRGLLKEEEKIPLIPKEEKNVPLKPKEEKILPLEPKAEEILPLIQKEDTNLPPISKEDIEKLRNFKVGDLPKRRNSMVEYGSAMMVDKDSLQFANTILYADIQCEKRAVNKKTALSEKYAHHVGENLANIFKKTDDNCALSAQNIISGKRRSRASINFNEVQQGIAVYRHIKNPTKPAAKTTNDLKKSKSKGKNKQKHEQKIEEPESSKLTTKPEDASDKSNNEMLEGFVQNIFKPNANKEYIFNLLRDILPEGKLNLVKSIIESANDTESTNTTESTPNQQIPGEEIPKRRIRKRNELELLNEDIRDMFISEGVITASGKRVCTLVNAACATKNDISKTSDSGDEEVIYSQPKPKSKKLKEIRKKMKKNKDKIKRIESKKIEADNIMRDIRKRKVTVKLTKLKFPPTETKIVVAATPAPITPSTETESLGENTKNKKKRSKKEMLKSGKKNILYEQRKKEVFDKLIKRSRVKILDDDGIRNTDPRWHSLSKYKSMCVVCDVNLKYPGTHYLQIHAENYISRLPSTLIKKLQKGALGKLLFHKKTKTIHSFGRCPFCLDYSYKSISEWLEHLTTHTGEYFFRCSYCHKTGNKPNIIQRHIALGTCPKGKCIAERPHSVKKRCIKGYVCNLCNFIQMHRHNVDRHFEEQHGFDKEKAKTLGFEVNLLDWNDIPTVNEKKAAALEKKEMKNTFSLLYDDEGIETEENELKNDGIETDENEMEESDMNPNDEEDSGDSESEARDEMKIENFLKVESVLGTEDSTEALPPCAKVETVFDNEMESEDDSVSATKKEKTPTPVDLKTDSTEKNRIICQQDPVKEQEDSSVKNVEENTKTESIPSAVIKQEKDIVPGKSALNNSNAFLPTPRDSDSPTINFTQKLLTIQKENNIEEESEMNKSAPVESIAERLSQRLKSMENQVVTTPDDNLRIEEEMLSDPEKLSSKNVKNQPCLEKKSNFEINDCDNQITSDDDCWEDIEVTEYSTMSKHKPVKVIEDNKKKQKENKKKLHRFYASNALRAKKIKDAYMIDKSHKGHNLKNIEVCAKNAEDERATAESSPMNVDVNTNMDNFTEKDPLSNDDPLTPMVYENELNKENSAVVSGGIKNGVNRINNIGFSKDQRESYKFYCLCEFCTFLYSSESVGLENHCLSEHAKLKWNGFCHTCNKQVIQYVSSLEVAQEIKHMLEYHVTEVDDTITMDSVISSVVSSEESEQPRIKIRRLSGDLLSVESPSLAGQDINPIICEELIVPDPVSFNIPQLPSSAEEVPQSHLQITNVRSLNSKTFSEVVPVVPRITNVVGSIPNFTIGTKTIVRPPKELSKSPEPIVVSETRPVTQELRGKYLITQTISAKFDDNGQISQVPEHHVAISLAQTPKISLANKSTISQVNKPAPPRNGGVYQCMANNCVFKTRVAVSMIDHLHFHEVRSFQTERDFLRCYICSEGVEDKVLLVDHIEQHWQTDTTAVKTTITKPKVVAQNTSTNPSTVVVARTKLQNADRAFREQLKEAIYGVMSSIGVKQEELYRCIHTGCNTNCEKPQNLLRHLKEHAVNGKNMGPYKCLYCKMKYARIDALILHLKNHGIQQYFCYVCSKTTATSGEMQKHYMELHGRMSSGCISMLYEPEPDDADKLSFYIWHASYLSENEVVQFAEKIIGDWLPKKFQSKAVYNSSESSQLPLQPIFHKEISCAECSYKTKVRTNMLRHLQMHREGNVVIAHDEARSDPVNPMPCLNSTERHFDKMTNLASSSLVTTGPATTNSTTTTSTTTTNPIISSITIAPSTSSANSTKVLELGRTFPSIEKCSSIIQGKPQNNLKVDYDYVPNSRIFTCGVPECQYISVSEELFRSHVTTLHHDVVIYDCPFCKEEICKRGIVMSRIITHLRYHGQWLYQCEECTYVHYFKAVVRRHVHERHGDLAKDEINLISYNRLSDWHCITTINLKQRSLITAAISNNTTNFTSISSDKIELPAANALSGQSKIVKVTKKEIRWQCDLCDHFSKTYNLIISHCNTCHGYRHRFQCDLCDVGYANIESMMKHFKHHHVGQKVSLKTIFHKETVDIDEESANGGQSAEQANLAASTRPLWQRNDPQRIRHIRGILMEDEEETEQHRKRLRLDDYEET